MTTEVLSEVVTSVGRSFDVAGPALLATTWLHAGFQLTVTLLVYPAFARVPAADWRAHHARHARAIAPLVGVVYLLLAAACLVVLATGPTALEGASVVLAGAAGLVTALVAAPAHARLGRGTGRAEDGGPDPRTLALLLTADRARAVLAVGAALLAAAAAIL